MPLAEFYLKAIEAMPGNTPSKMGNSSPEQILMPDSDFAELLLENGQVVMHGHPSRPRKSLTTTTTTGRDQERDNGNENDCYPKNAQMSPFELPGNDFLTARNDDMVPWINYSINESFPNEPLQSNLFSEFMEELSGANLDSSLCTCADGSDSFGQEVRDLDNVEHVNESKALTETSEHGRSKTSQFLQLSQPCQSPDLNSNTRIPDSGTGVSTKTQAGACTESPKTRLLNQNLATSTPSRPIKNLENFSLFSRPLTASTANLQIADRLRSNEKTSAPVDSNCMESTMIKSSSRINCMESTMTKSSSRIKGVTDIQGHSASVLTKSELEAFKSPLHGQSESICEGDAPGKDNNNQNNGCSSTAFKKHETGKVHEVVVTTSSMCSVSSAGSDLKHRRKRKISEGEESSTYLSEDLEDELACKKKYAAARRTGTKRSRATEVHNLSERRRRDKINEKMRALQELIPNCNKADKASMLEEAIEYLKTLQLQVQIMSMGSGMYMPPVMLPPGMPHMRAPCMSHFSPMRVGMGVRYGMGMYDMNASCPVMPVPPMHGLQFPCPPVHGPPMHGILGPVNPQMFGPPCQGMVASVPRPPPVGSSSGLIAKNSSVPEIRVGPTDPVSSLDVAPSASADQKES